MDGTKSPQRMVSYDEDSLAMSALPLDLEMEGLLKSSQVVSGTGFSEKVTIFFLFPLLVCKCCPSSRGESSRQYFHVDICQVLQSRRELLRITHCAFLLPPRRGKHILHNADEVLILFFS